MENLKDLCINNSASILTGLGVVGVIGTAVVTAKLTPKALDILEEREKFDRCRSVFRNGKYLLIYILRSAY